MKKFKFSLESVLIFKNMILDNLKNEHAKIIAEVLAQENKIISLNQQHKDLNTDFNEKKLTGMTIVEATTYKSYIETLEQRTQQELGKLEDLKVVEAEKQSQVVEAKKEVSSLDKLKEQNLVAYNAMVSKSEELLMEEFVINSMFSQA